MYGVHIISPSIQDRIDLHSQGITTMTFTMIEMMHFFSLDEIHAYLQNIKAMYPEYKIRYSIYSRDTI